MSSGLAGQLVHGNELWHSWQHTTRIWRGCLSALILVSPCAFVQYFRPGIDCIHLITRAIRTQSYGSPNNMNTAEVHNSAKIVANHAAKSHVCKNLIGYWYHNFLFFPFLFLGSSRPYAKNTPSV